jgi:hypothetical protein
MIPCASEEPHMSAPSRTATRTATRSARSTRTSRRLGAGAIRLVLLLAISTAMLSGTAAPGRAIPPSMTPDVAALLAVPGPTCAITHTPTILTGLDDVTIGGSVTGFIDWIEALLADPEVWGQDRPVSIRAVISSYPRRAGSPIDRGPVFADGPDELRALTDGIFSPDSVAFDAATDKIITAGVDGFNDDPALAAVVVDLIRDFESDGVLTADWTFPGSALPTTFDAWGLPTPSDAAPAELDVLIALSVASLFDLSDVRTIVIPCTARPAVAATPRSAPGPTLSCTPAVPQVGRTVTCTTAIGTPGFDVVWRASYNPTFAEGVLTTDADGRGTFAFTVPSDALGSELSVELVDWTRPIPIGTAVVPVPGRIDAGLGGDLAAPAARTAGALAVVAVLAMLGLQTARGVSRQR